MMRKVGKNFIIISAVLILFITQFSVALAEDTKVSVSAPDEVKPGDVFSAYIMIEDVTDFVAGQFDLSFDSDVITVVDVKNGEIESQDVPILAWNFKPGTDNYLRVVYDLPGADGVSGSGYLAEIIFEVKGADGDTSSIEISNLQLGNKNAEEITADWSSGEVKVDASATPQPTTIQESTYQGSSGYAFNETETSGEATITTSEKVTRSIPAIQAGTKTSVVFSDMDISMITLEVDQDLSNIELSMQPRDLPREIPEPDGVLYSSYEIKAEELDGVEVTATIDFRVLKSWIEENSIDKATITLNRYHNGKWQELPTFMAGEDENFVNYQAESTGFSYFAITGEVVTGSEMTPASRDATSTPIPTTTSLEAESTAGTEITWGVIIAAILLTAVICAAVFIFLSKRK